MRNDRPPLTHVACIDTEGRVWSLPAPCRHRDVLRVMRGFGAEPKEDEEVEGRFEGFLDQNGQYLTRVQALVSAELNSQIKRGKISGRVLTSEDLW